MMTSPIARQGSSVLNNDRSRHSFSSEFPEVAAELVRRGVVFVLVHYEGQHGTENWEDPYYLDAERQLVDAQDLGSDGGLLADRFLELLEDRCESWNDGQGACGQFEWNIATGALSHIHRSRHIAYHVSTFVGF
jgi:hypothetical protein